jgi:hypothetical protein
LDYEYIGKTKFSISFVDAIDMYFVQFIGSLIIILDRGMVGVGVGEERIILFNSFMDHDEYICEKSR